MVFQLLGAGEAEVRVDGICGLSYIFFARVPLHRIMSHVIQITVNVIFLQLAIDGVENFRWVHRRPAM